MGRKHGIWGKYPRLTILAGCAALAGGTRSVGLTVFSPSPGVSRTVLWSRQGRPPGAGRATG